LYAVCDACLHSATVHCINCRKFVKVVIVELEYFDEFEYLGHTISNDG